MRERGRWFAVAVVALLSAGCPKAFPEDEALTAHDGGSGGMATGTGAAGHGGTATGTGGAGGHGGTATGTGGAGGQACTPGPIGVNGDPCCTANELACAGHAQKLVLLCEPASHTWGALQACSGQQLCDTRVGGTAGSCQDPAPLCVGKQPGDEVCDGNTSVECGPDLLTSTETPCPSVCKAGACVGVCKPQARQCNGTTPEACDGDGAWQSEAACAYLCKAGECTGECAPGVKDCSAKTPRTCDANGVWQSAAPCANVCSDGLCVAACKDGTHQCSALIPETCVAGAWQDGASCANVCANGVCTGVCSPGAKDCNTNKPRTCDANGAWKSGSACTYVCSAGACTGVCAPGVKQCTGLKAQTCDAFGVWVIDQLCPYLCTAGACTGVCSPGAKQCAGLVPQTCNPSGDWENGAKCANVCTAGTCSGSCNPGTKQCNGLDLQTCDNGGAWQTSTCPYVCSNGACTGVCAPASKQCSGLVPQTCDANGAWQGVTACNGTNGTASCGGAGLCSIACGAGYGDCDADVGNGCETSTSTDVKHCGNCPNVCGAVANGTPGCAAGDCTIASCNAPYGNCDGLYANGCETKTTGNLSNCGGCGLACTNAHGTTTCAGGLCVPACSAGYDDCDGDPNNGCESNTNKDANHCGTCATKCSGGTPTCTGGKCGLLEGPSCAGGLDCGVISCCDAPVVPGGTFPMGRSEFGTDAYAGGGASELPEHKATVADFRLDTFEVTVGRFRKFVNAFNGTPPAAKAGAHPLIEDSGWQAGWPLAGMNAELKININCDATYQTWTFSAAGGHESYPMNCVNWYEAFAFCVWDGGRMPTEAEWEYAAAGGGDNRLYPWANGAAPNNTLAVFNCAFGGTPANCTFADLAPVGTTLAGNGKWGHRDLAGGMWEWNLDWYDDVSWYQNACDNCANLVLGKYAERGIRGGSWNDAATYDRSANRNHYDPALHVSNLGFRCARSVP